MNYLIYILIFIFGSCIGSFLNVVILRLKANEKFVFGRSHCVNCNHQLKWFENIPLLSFVFLKGKCLKCKQKISLQYFFVELSTGILFFLAFLKVFEVLDISPGLGVVNIFLLLFYFITISFLIIIFVYDLKYYLILDKISIPAIAVVLFFQAFLLFLNKNLLFTDYLLFIFSGIIISGFFLLQFIISKGKWIGGGDIRLGFLMGIILGFPMSLVALFLSYILGLIVSLPLLIIGKKRMKSEIPFGTFLVAGTIITMFLGDKILNWYLNLF